MAPAEDPNEPIAVVGTGQAGMAALINTMVSTWYDTPDEAPAFKILIIKSGSSKIDKSAEYPLGDVSAGNLHPFYSEQPPEGFPKFGQYVADMLPTDSRFRTALLIPTYGQVNEYLEYLLELAIVSIGDKVLLEAVNEPVQDIQESQGDGPATILFKDGTSRTVRKLVRSRDMPHMAGARATARAAQPALVEDLGLHPSRLRMRDYLVIVAGKLAVLERGGKTAPAVWTYFVDRKPELAAIPAEQDLSNVPSLEEEGGTDFEVLYHDPPHTGAAQPYPGILDEQKEFLLWAALHKPFESPKTRDLPAAVAREYAFSVLWRAVNRARHERGTEYARALVGRLHQHRWLPGSRMAAFLLVQADGGFGREVHARAADASYIMSRVNALKERIDQAKNGVTNLTEWTEALYRLNPEVQEVLAYLERSELKHTKEWHRYYSQVDEDIKSVHLFNLSSVVRKFMGSANAPTWTSTYIVDLRASEDAAKYRELLDALFEQRVIIPKYWRDAALSFYDTPADSIPEELTEVEPYRAVSVGILEAWSQEWLSTYQAT